ncbi:hypothetical protein M9458_000970, partial [Cirrhinus mrigala]
GKREDENGKLVMNSSELINTDICGKKKAETSMLINANEDMEISDNQVGSLLSCGDMPDNVKCSVGEIATEENSSRNGTVLQNTDSQKGIQNQTTEISVPLTSEEDIMKETMTSADDIGDADHAMSPTKKDFVVSTNELRAMEGIEVNFCMNPDSTPAEHLRSSEATVSDECSFEASSDVQAEHNVSCVADCLEKEDDSGRNQEGQMIEETLEEKETEVLRANEFVEENALLGSNDGCWESTSGWDDNDQIDVEGEQYCAEMIDGQTPLEEDELSKGHIANAEIADHASNK